MKIEQKDLVVGDLVLLKVGWAIPADIILTKNSPDFKVNDTLTGETHVSLRAIENGSRIDNFFEAGNIAHAFSEII